MKYIRAHWRGDHSLLWSFIVNFALVRLLILAAAPYTLPPHLSDRTVSIVATILFTIFFHGPVFLWQVVGLLRACHFQARRLYADMWRWVGNLMVLISFVFGLISIFSGYQTLAIYSLAINDRADPANDRRRQYTLTVQADGTRVQVGGIFALGITDNLRELLDRNPRITGVVLRGDGGQVYEGRGLAQLINRRGLATYVFGTCKSACATAFIGGKHRTIGPHGRLGFHRYRLELHFPMPLVDIEQEQKTDLSFFRQQGISDDFLQHVFRASPEKIWFPDYRELLEAGVVHNMVDR